jgi:hypothetical protein
MKILFFAPHTAIWVHAFPEALVAEALRQGGHEIVYVTCGRQLRRYCVAMSAHRVAPAAPDVDKRQVCDLCDARKRIIREQFGFKGYDLSELISQEGEHQVEELVGRMTRDSLMTFELEGIPIGRLALYQFMLLRKRIDTDLGDEEWGEYLNELRNALYAFYAAKRVLVQERPDRVIVYNGLYSVNRVCCKLAEQRGIPHYFMHAGGNLSHRLQTLLFGRGDTFVYMPHCVEAYAKFAHLPCTGRLLKLVTDHYLELLRGQSHFVYSSGKSTDLFDARARFGVKPGQKLLLATMASYDEEMAAEMVGARQHRTTPLFPTQVEWIRALLEFAKSRSDLFFLIRVHPREFPNRRERAKSQHAGMLEEALRGLPENAAVNWPADGISLYDLAEQTDVVLNSWSSTGKEMSLLGLPVVIYSRELPFYPAELNYVGTTREEYFACIEQALAAGWNGERVRRAYRWGVFEFVRATVYIGDSYPELEHPVRPLHVKVVERLRRCFDPYFRERRDCGRRKPELATAALIRRLIETGARSPLEVLNPSTVEQTDVEEETHCLGQELRRLAEALYPDPEARRSSRLYPLLYSFTGRDR